MRLVPPLEGKQAPGGKATAYVCRGKVCDLKLPTSDPNVLAAQLVPTKAAGLPSAARTLGTATDRVAPG
jgi:hypothetical protein